MSQQAKKTENNKPVSENRRESKFALQAVKSLQKTENEVLEMNSKGVKNLIDAAGTCSQVASELASICSGNFNCVVESGSKIARVFRDVGSEIMESADRHFSDLSKLSQEAVACRDINDMIELQTRRVKQAIDNYFETTSNICNILFDNYGEVMAPLSERTAEASKQIQEALAA